MQVEVKPVLRHELVLNSVIISASSLDEEMKPERLAQCCRNTNFGFQNKVDAVSNLKMNEFQISLYLAIK